MKKGNVIEPRETIPRKVKASLIDAEEVKMIKKALSQSKPSKRNVKCNRKRAHCDKINSQIMEHSPTSLEGNCQKWTVVDKVCGNNIENRCKDFGRSIDKENEINNPINQLNMSGLSHFMDLEERKDLLVNNIDDPLCINGPETYDAIGWVPIKQEPIEDDELEVSCVTITELPFNKPIEERRFSASISPVPSEIPSMPSETDSEEECANKDKDEGRTTEIADKIAVESILKESNTIEGVLECTLMSETKSIVNDNCDEDTSWDSGQDLLDDNDDDSSSSNDVDDSGKKPMTKKWMQRVHKCDICDKTLSSKGSLRIHKKKKHKIVIKFNCELCTLDFELLRDLIKHRNEEHRGKDGRFTCKECGKYICDYKGFLVHLKSHFDDLQMFDKEEASFKCTECDMVFTREEGLQLHKAMSHNVGSAFGEKLKQQQKNYVCDTCGKRFAFGCLLRDHVNLHTGSRPYLCQQCGRSFAQKASLKQHARTHNSVRPFQCGVCNQGFYGKGDLKKHSRKHTGERPYVCEMCGDGFSQSSHLGVHRRSHTGEKPFKCDLCSRGFSKKGDVVRHRRIHTGELPYLCQVCGKGFRQSTQCSNHIKNHHPDAHETIVTSNNSSSTACILP